MKFWKISLVGIVLFISNSANAALLSRLGGLAYYDTETDLTWLADANYAMTSGYDDDGRMSWADANIWASTLNVEGVTGWRLAQTIDIGNDGCSLGIDCGDNIDTSTGEMARLFYDTLGNVAYYDTDGNYNPNWGLSNSGPFLNIQEWHYWSATEVEPHPLGAWLFTFGNAHQTFHNKDEENYAWAMQSGDIAAVPIPAALWLFGSGLIGLAGFARRK